MRADVGLLFVGQFAEQLLLLPCREFLGHLDLDLHQQVTLAAPRGSGMPRPRSRNTSPGCVPAGIFSPPGRRSWALRSSRPSAACEYVIGTWQIRCRPSRVKERVLLTWRKQ